jgi:hypothetical protein
MWHLEQPTDTQLKEYKKLFFNKIKYKIEKSTIKDAFSKYSDSGEGISDALNDILIGKPNKLKEANDLLMKHIFENYSETEWNDFIDKHKKGKTKGKSIFSDNYDIIVNIFNYKRFISDSKSVSYKISEIKAKNTCCYCNRQYTLHVVKNGGTNNDNRITRPEFDHWFSKERYPLLSLSFFNLIPSCSICNSSVKGTANFTLDTHVHPYLDEHKSMDFNFTRVLKTTNEWKIEIDNKDNLECHVKKMIQDLKIEEIYDYHSKLELQDIMDFRIANNGTYLTTLFKDTLKNFPSKTPAQVYRMLFGVEYDKSNFWDRPFSKLKYDILKKEGLIDEIGNI